MYSDLSAESTYRAMQQLLTLNPGPTAVIAFNDYVALDAMRYARKMRCNGHLLGYNLDDHL